MKQSNRTLIRIMNGLIKERGFIDIPQFGRYLFRMSRANRMNQKKKEFCTMNFVPRTSLRWAPESRVGGSKEIESEEIE